MTGIIKNVTDRNFGFIRGEGGGEYFFHRDDFSGHWKDLLDDVKNSSVRVTFDTIDTPKGLRAQNVERTEFPNMGR